MITLTLGTNQKLRETSAEQGGGCTPHFYEPGFLLDWQLAVILAEFINFSFQRHKRGLLEPLQKNDMNNGICV